MGYSGVATFAARTSVKRKNVKIVRGRAAVIGYNFPRARVLHGTEGGKEGQAESQKT